MAIDRSVILGISYGHGDSSAALIVNDVLVAAAEEERFTRKKHYGLFPENAIRYCLKHAGIKPESVKTIAVAKRPWNGLIRKIKLLIQEPQLYQIQRQHREKENKKSPSAEALLKAMGFSSPQIYRVEHHLAHLMSAKFMAPKEDVALLSIDGMGDFVSVAMGKSHGNEVEIVSRVYFPHSLGYFYTALTQFLGFPYFGDEFKVMGLSSYGNPTYLPVMKELIRENPVLGFELNLEAFPLLANPMKFYLDEGQPKIEPFYCAGFLTQVLGLTPRRARDPITQAHCDLAHSVQIRFEEIANHLLGQLHDRVGGTTLAIAGGCAHNSVWVGKIPQNSHYKEVFVAPASHDAGIAVGAAIQIAKKIIRPEGGHWGLLGPSLAEATELQNTKTHLPSDTTSKKFKNEKALVDWLVTEIMDEKIIGFFDGRMEFGPRALGNRSILADPRNEGMKNRLNERVKHRESFRPFAASVLWEYQSEWFEKSFFSPNMEAVFKVNSSLRNKVAGVVHADGSCRIQSVTQEHQPLFWNLIDAFRKRTGIPMLINTSFNDSEPIVCTPSDAIRCFSGSEMDHLIIGLNVYSRKHASLSLTA